MHRTVLIALLLLFACSKADDKTKPGADPSKTGTGPTPASKREKTIKGTIALGGALSTPVSLPPGSDFLCDCISETTWHLETTYSNGSDTFVGLTLDSTKGMELTSAKLKDAVLKSNGTAGVKGSCTPDRRNADGVMSFDLDGKVTGKSEEVTLKGHLDVVCREGF